MADNAKCTCGHFRDNHDGGTSGFCVVAGCGCPSWVAGPEFDSAGDRPLPRLDETALMVAHLAFLDGDHDRSLATKTNDAIRAYLWAKAIIDEQDPDGLVTGPSLDDYRKARDHG